MDKRILIVEDEVDIANVFKKQLTFAGGYIVDLALGGEEALKLMETNKYDLVLLDLVMQRVDGIEVLTRLRDGKDKYQKSPVIALTNVTAEDTKIEVGKFGVQKFLVKTDIDLLHELTQFFHN